jgi:FKBP-type peptidyl-prolyl cis-trans isomerase FkpA/FKBP-type peptidyl-prolyl cis-trans isomerase FklB
MKPILYALSALLCIGLPGAPATGAELTTDEQKTLYALGVAVGQSLGQFALSESDLEIVLSGISDNVRKRPLQVDMQTFGPKLQQLAQARAAAVAEKEKEAGAAYVAKAAAEPGASKTESGAIVQTLKEGNGPTPTAADTVKVHYHGTLADGTVFDSSVDRGEPATFPLDGVIKCWTEGVQKVKVGGKSRLVCPADTAYGDRGSPPVIKPGATLIFEVELLEIVQQ